MSERPIPLAEPHLGGNERAYLAQCIDTNYVSSVGPFVDEFERAFAEYVGAAHAVACSSGTAALHLALRALDIGPGDDVVVPSLTFIASANAIRYVGANPVLADSERETWNLDPGLVADDIGARVRAGRAVPRAVEVVHLLGHPASIEPLLEICERHGIVLIEDAAEALGATYVGGPLDGRGVGTVGRIGCFSFNGNKIITTGGGGMLVTDDGAIAARARHLSTQARLPGIAYDHDDVGFNYRLSNVAAALGMAQLEQLTAFLASKRRLAARYDVALADLPDVAPAPRASWADPSFWLYSIGLRDAGLSARIVDGLNRAGIGARPVWTPLHTMSPYADAARIGTGEVARAIAATSVSLPSSVGLPDADHDRITDSLRALLQDVA